MKKWEYKVFASHLDPAELVLILDESGREGWELVTAVAVVDYVRPEVLGVAPVGRKRKVSEPAPLEAFRYIFKRPAK